VILERKLSIPEHGRLKGEKEEEEEERIEG